MRNTSRRRMKGAKGLSLKFYDYSFRGSICIFHFFELTHEPPPQMIIAVRQSHQIPATMLWAIYIRTTLKCIHSGSKKKKKRDRERGKYVPSAPEDRHYRRQFPNVHKTNQPLPIPLINFLSSSSWKWNEFPIFDVKVLQCPVSLLLCQEVERGEKGTI